MGGRENGGEELGRWLGVDMRLDLILLLLDAALIPHRGCIIDFSHFIYIHS